MDEAAKTVTGINDLEAPCAPTPVAGSFRAALDAGAMLARSGLVASEAESSVVGQFGGLEPTMIVSSCASVDFSVRSTTFHYYKENP